MKRTLPFAFALVILASGCRNESAPTESSSSPLVIDTAPPSTVDVHAHAAEGPHHGTLIELGNEEFHAELVHDEGSVTVHVLDGSATKTVAVDATEVTINLVYDGKPAQFKLLASPEANDPTGKSSRFTVQDGQLVEELEHGHGGAKLSLQIGGKAYRGEIKHDHGEHGHIHAN